MRKAQLEHAILIRPRDSAVTDARDQGHRPGLILKLAHDGVTKSASSWLSVSQKLSAGLDMPSI